MELTFGQVTRLAKILKIQLADMTPETLVETVAYRLEESPNDPAVGQVFWHAESDEWRYRRGKAHNLGLGLDLSYSVSDGYLIGRAREVSPDAHDRKIIVLRG